MSKKNEDQDYMLTTFDNPFNPFDDFETWFKYDMLLGHDSCGLLAKESSVSIVASDEINDEETILAMERIVSRFPMIYRKVKKEDFSFS